MTTIIRHSVFGFAAVALAVGLHWLQGELDRARSVKPEIQEFLYLPSGEQMKLASLGYEQVAADLLWLKAVQVMGERKVSEQAGRWLFRALDVVTTLDPSFVQVYEAGGIALTTMVVLPEESNRLLEKGMVYNPTVWKLPFLIGFNHYFELRDDAKAADYIARASRLPGAPPYLAPLAARLYAASREPQVALDFLAQAYEQTTEENVREVIAQRIKEVVIERDLQLMEQAIEQFHERHRRYPDRLHDLVADGLLNGIPSEPFGGGYVYDRDTHRVRSSTMKDRLEMHGHRRVA